MTRSDEKGADSRGVGCRIEQVCVTNGTLIAAVERPAAAPAATRDNPIVIPRDEITAVGDERRIDAKDVADGGIDLRRRVVADTEGACRLLDERLKHRNVRIRGVVQPNLLANPSEDVSGSPIAGCAAQR